MTKQEPKKSHLINELSNAVYWIEDTAHDPSEVHISAFVEGIHEAMKLIQNLSEKEINNLIK